MRRVGSGIALAVALAACTTSSPPTFSAPPNLIPIEIPEGQDCSETISITEAEDAQHVTSPAEFNHNTDPPTSGRHLGEWITPTGVYDRPLADGLTVHNLEHGHVIVAYDNVAPEQIEAIAAPVRADPVKVLALPRPGMAWKLALTAWTRIQVCSEIPDDVTDIVRDFIIENRDSGLSPESVD